jgi:hypothetical protein
MNVTIENFIGVFENAFSKEYCDELIKHFEDCHEVGLSLTRQQDDPTRAKTLIDDNQVYLVDFLSAAKPVISTFNHIFWNQIHPVYADKFDVLKKHGQYANYTVKLQRTDVGQGYHVWHCESTNKDTCNRLLVWTLYLNDVEEGGETEFLYYPRRIKPKTGTLVIWPSSFMHTHRGNPPLSNTKYIATGILEF